MLGQHEILKNYN